MQMTFQVVMFGIDGLLVGSDRKAGTRTFDGRDYQFQPGSKFCENPQRTVLCLFAGGPQAKAIADIITVECNPSESNLAAWHCCLRVAAEKIKARSVGDEILVIRPSIPDIVLVSKRDTDATVGPPLTEKLCIGVYAHSRFLVEHFWRPAPLSELRKLMLVTLAYAAKERPESVGDGFDIFTIKAGKYEMETVLPDALEVARASNQMSEAIGGVLFPVS
jgi:hypothetical protein